MDRAARSPSAHAGIHRALTLLFSSVVPLGRPSVAVAPRDFGCAPERSPHELIGWASDRSCRRGETSTVCATPAPIHGAIHTSRLRPRGSPWPRWRARSICLRSQRSSGVRRCGCEYGVLCSLPLKGGSRRRSERRADGLCQRATLHLRVVVCAHTLGARRRPQRPDSVVCQCGNDQPPRAANAHNRRNLDCRL